MRVTSIFSFQRFPFKSNASFITCMQIFFFFTTQSRRITTKKKKKTFENIMGKGEKAFSSFSTMFSIPSRTEIIIFAIFRRLHMTQVGLSRLRMTQVDLSRLHMTQIGPSRLRNLTRVDTFC